MFATIIVQIYSEIIHFTFRILFFLYVSREWMNRVDNVVVNEEREQIIKKKKIGILIKYSVK